MLGVSFDRGIVGLSHVEIVVIELLVEGYWQFFFQNCVPVWKAKLLATMH